MGNARISWFETALKKRLLTMRTSRGAVQWLLQVRGAWPENAINRSGGSVRYCEFVKQAARTAFVGDSRQRHSGCLAPRFRRQRRLHAGARIHPPKPSQ